VIALSKSDFKRSGFSDESVWNAALNEQVSEGYSITVARRFNINFTDFPCFVLFEDIRSPERVIFTFKGLSSQQIASQMRLIFSLIQQARSDDIKPLKKLTEHQKAEEFQRVSQTLWNKVSSFAGKTFEAAMESRIKTII
jgi:hypothetical protein